MAYLGRGVDIGMFEKQILTPDGTTTSFTLTYAVGSANSLQVSYGGVLQEPGVAYSVSGGGQTIVFSEAPAAGTTLYIIYYGKQLTTPRAAGQETTKQTFAGNGSTVTFTLTDPPVVPAGIMVFVDGILQREGSGNNYVSSGSTITFSSAPDSSAEIDVYTLVKEKVSIDTVADGSITVTKLAASHPTWNSAGDFTFPLTGSRIRGDFSNATIANRVMFQTSTVNAASVVGVIPNGTGTISQFAAFGSSDTANAQVTRVDVRGGTESRIESTFAGTPASGTYLPMTFYVGGSERARINTSGNVGIGTTLASSYGMKLAVQTNIGLIPTTQDTVGSIVSLKSQLGSSGGEDFIQNQILTFANGANYTTGLNFNLRNGASTAEGMRLTNTGLGIGTATPVAKLDSRGTVYVATAFNGDNVLAFGGNPASGAVYTGAPANGNSFIVGESSNASGNPGFLKFYTTFSGVTSERMRIDSSGNLLVGLTSALGNFSINITPGAPATSGNMSRGLTVTNTSGGRALNFGVNESGGYTYIQSAYVNSADNAQPVAFFTGPTERARIDSSGNVGIGTSSPADKLEVYSTITARTGSGTSALRLRNTTSDYQWQTVAGTNAISLFDNAVGSARVTLDASGNLQFNSGYGSVATAYGCRAWVNFNGTGTVAIRGSGNVSSITDNGTGDYTVNFTTAMPDANYGYNVSGREDESGTLTWGAVPQPARVAQTTTTFRIITKQVSGTAFDFNSVSLSVFR